MLRKVSVILPNRGEKERFPRAQGGRYPSQQDHRLTGTRRFSPSNPVTRGAAIDWVQVEGIVPAQLRTQ